MTTTYDKKELMAAVTGAIWKCASSAENVERFQELGLIAVLIKILKENCDALDDLQFNPQKIDVLTNVVGAISGQDNYESVIIGSPNVTVVPLPNLF